MSKVNEKAKKWVRENIVLPEYADIEYTDLVESLVLLLKEQDRDTRHACAEAVLSCDEDVSGECVWKDEAHRACMNVQAV